MDEASNRPRGDVSEQMERGMDESLTTRSIVMKNEWPDGQTVAQLLERSLGRSLTAGVDGGATPVFGALGSPVVVGQVLDTHDPQQRGRVYVSWFAEVDEEQRAWLHHERQLALQRGDRVLVTLPLGWAEWLVTGALAALPRIATNREAARTEAARTEAARTEAARTEAARTEAARTEAARTEAARTEAALAAEQAAAVATPAAGAVPTPMALQLEPGQPLIILGSAGEPLLRIYPGTDGPVVEFAHDQVELKARERLRLSAHAIELVAGQGGVDICTEGDAVMRAKAIRLN
jgi:hypothetical protein